jgi:hypothetical protein
MLVIGYAVLSSVAVFTFSALFVSFCVRQGLATASERGARTWAFIMRGSEVLLAAGMILCFWNWVAPLTRPWPWIITIIAWIYTGVIGGTYIAGSLFAFVTIPLASQYEYFSTMERRMRD